MFNGGFACVSYLFSFIPKQPTVYLILRSWFPSGVCSIVLCFLVLHLSACCTISEILQDLFRGMIVWLWIPPRAK